MAVCRADKAFKPPRVRVASDAGLVQAGSTVDVFMTATVNIIDPATAAGATPVPGTTPLPYQTEKSTKVTYQNIEILSRVGQEIGRAHV